MNALSVAPSSAAAPQGAALREILTIAFRDRRRIGAALLLGLALTAAVALMAPKKYISEAALLLRLGREYIYTPEVGDPSNSVPIAYDREQTLLAEAKILTSRDIKESVVDKMGVTQIYPALAGVEARSGRDQAVLAMEKSLEAELLKGSNLMQVGFSHADPAVAAKVLSELIDAYLKKRSIIFSSAAYGNAEADFVARTIQLNAAEAKLAALKSERRIRAFPEEQSLLLAQRNALEVRQADNALALAQARGRASVLNASMGGLTADVVLSSETQRSEAIENARRVLLDLRLKERDLSSKYVDTNPAVVDVRADLARTTEFLRDLERTPSRVVRTGRSPSRDVVEADLMRTQADQGQARAGVGALAAQRAAIDARLTVLAESEQDLRALERDRRLAEINYEAAAKRLRDEMVLDDLDRKRKSNVSIVQPPLVPLQAKSLVPIIALVGVFLSLCAALLTAFLSALWRDTFITPEQAERSLGLPLLAAVPEGRR